MMMKILPFVLLLVGMSEARAQTYALTESAVEFHSYTPVEEIRAKNTSTSGTIDVKTNHFSFKIPIADFIFPLRLMQEHFNENYLESETYPFSTYHGSIDGEYDLSKDGTYTVITRGNFTIHGVTKVVAIPAAIVVEKGDIKLASYFKIKLVDYKIDVPTLLFQKIAEVIDVKINARLKN